MMTLTERLDKKLERVDALTRRLEEAIAKAGLLIEAGERMVAEVSAAVLKLKEYQRLDETGGE